MCLFAFARIIFIVLYISLDFLLIGFHRDDEQPCANGRHEVTFSLFPRYNSHCLSARHSSLYLDNLFVVVHRLWRLLRRRLHQLFLPPQRKVTEFVKFGDLSSLPYTPYCLVHRFDVVAVENPFQLNLDFAIPMLECHFGCMKSVIIEKK